MTSLILGTVPHLHSPDCSSSHTHGVQVLSIVTVAVAFIAMAGSIFGMNLYFNVQTTPPVSVVLLIARCSGPHGLERLLVLILMLVICSCA